MSLVACVNATCQSMPHQLVAIFVTASCMDEGRVRSTREKKGTDGRGKVRTTGGGIQNARRVEVEVRERERTRIKAPAELASGM